MLKICHVGWEFLTLKDAYLNYGCDAEFDSSWGLDLSHIEIPIQRSLEQFSLLLKRYGAILIKPCSE